MDRVFDSVLQTECGKQKGEEKRGNKNEQLMEKHHKKEQQN
jgi:hypothetical protein